MKLFKLTFIIFFLWSIAYPLSAQNWLWAKNFTGTSNNFGGYVTTKFNGHIYCFGGYETNGNVNTGQTVINSIGHFNAFVAEFDQQGNFITITNVPSTTIDHVDYGGETFRSNATVDNNKNTYIGIDITDNGLIDTISVTGTPFVDKLVLTKWNADSRCLWVKTFPGSAIEPKSDGNFVYLTGYYQNASVQIDTFTLQDPNNKFQSYLAKLDTQGTCQWVKQAVGGNTSFFYMDVNGNHIYISATTDSCFEYDTLRLCSSNGMGILMMLDTSGSVLWSKKITFDGHASIGGIAAIKGGGFYNFGSFDSVLYLGNDTLHKLGNEVVDLYIAKYDDSGNLLWINQIPINRVLAIFALQADSLGYFYITGYFTGTETFGNDTITAQSAADLFITRYTPNGVCMGVVTVPNAKAIDLTEDSAGNAIVTGVINGTVNFGTTTLFDTTTFFGNYIDEFFVAKLSAITGHNNNLLPKMLDDRLEIYANPNKGMFTIVVPQSLVQAASAQLNIYDNAGAELKNETVDISGNKIQVELGTVQKGLYNVTLSSKGKQFVGKVVIQ